MKKLWPVLATSLVAFSSLSAADNSGSMKSSSTQPKDNTTGVQGGYDLSISAELLLWKPQADYARFAKTGVSGSVREPDFDYDVGFRVGASYTMPHDRWNLGADWAHLRGSASKSVDGAAAGTTAGTGFSPHAFGVIQAFNGNDSNTDQYLDNVEGTQHFDENGGLHARWKVRLDLVDLALKRDFQLSKWICVAPHIGLRTAWIDQHEHYKVFSTSGTFSQVSESNHYWGLGIRTGLNTQFGLGRGWSIFGNAAAALLYGHDKLDADNDVGQWPKTLNGSTTVNPAGTQFAGTRSFNTSRACADYMLGLRWNHLFSDNRYGLTLQAAYEQHIFFNMAESAVDGANIQNGDLTFMGWTFSARFDF